MSNKLYLEAARRVAEEESHYSCLAVCHAAQEAHGGSYIRSAINTYAHNYWKLYANTEVEFQYAIEDWKTGDPDDFRHLRVMLLLFAAEALA